MRATVFVIDQQKENANRIPATAAISLFNRRLEAKEVYEKPAYLPARMPGDALRL